MSQRSYSSMYERFYEWLDVNDVKEWKHLAREFSFWQRYRLTTAQERVLKMASPAFGIIPDKKYDKKGSFVYRKTEEKRRFVWRDSKGRFTKQPSSKDE